MARGEELHSRLSFVVSGGNHRALAHKLFGKMQFPDTTVRFYDDNLYNEKTNEALLYLESEFGKAIFVLNQEDEVKALVKTLKQQLGVKCFFLHYFAGRSEVNVSDINAAFQEIKTHKQLTPPSKLKKLFAKFFDRNEVAAESPLIKAYKEWALQNPDPQGLNKKKK